MSKWAPFLLWKIYDKEGSFTQLANNSNGALMRFDYSPGNCQSQPGSASLAAARFF
jgi:hypothetical protein